MVFLHGAIIRNFEIDFHIRNMTFGSKLNQPTITEITMRTLWLVVWLDFIFVDSIIAKKKSGNKVAPHFDVIKCFWPWLKLIALILILEIAEHRLHKFPQTSTPQKKKIFLKANKLGNNASTEWHQLSDEENKFRNDH